MKIRLPSTRLLALAVAASAALVVTATAAPASAAPSTATLRGTTSVTTAPGIATTLLKVGVLPLPVWPRTSLRLGLPGGQLAVTYGFPITGGNPNLAGPSGDILHAGGIRFIGKGASLEIGKFDIDLAAGKIFATQVNFKPGRIAVLDLDLSKLVVSERNGATVLSGIGLKLDPAAAGALNSTFRIALPADGSLLFGTGTVVLR